MPAFQILECMVAVGGDEQNIVHRSHDRPVTYPEMLILQFLHGEESVTDAYELRTEERDGADELARLRVTYGARAVLDVFPGNRPRLPLSDTRIKPRVALTKPKRKPVPSRDDLGLPPDLDTLREGE